ncbi:hypothetical protein CK203_015949 [Vitis vinifera]|uniref:Uncharacterized protein n=1 Tax=Vitis vinifera TaxID=29760 RepID=A0A438JRL8_VITVI|nr:hypothetical protein CK203_015949 [Vitis vinifera]
MMPKIHMGHAHSLMGYINQGVVSGGAPLRTPNFLLSIEDASGLLILIQPQRSLLGVYSTFFPFANMDRSVVASTSDRTQCGRAKSSWSGRSLSRHLIGELSEQEFCSCCYIPDSISILLSYEEALSIDRLPNNMIYFTKE